MNYVGGCKMLTLSRLFVIGSIACVTLLTSCGGDSKKEPQPSLPDNYSYSIPVQKNDGWQVASLSEAEIADRPIQTLMDNIYKNNDSYRFIDSVLIIKDNKLVLDEVLRTELDLADSWANNTDIDLHILNSVTKSFVSALVGIAIDQGYIEGVEVKVHDYFTHKQPIENWREEKTDITLKNWLTMRHGYLWDEWDVSYLDTSNLNSQMNNAADPIQFLLDRPMSTIPGEKFAYSTGVSFGLGRIVQLATGQSVSSFMEQNLFQPLGIEKYDYWALDGQIHTGSALYLSNRDMAKFGQLFLDSGMWQGQQIISSAWVTQSTQKHVDKGAWGYAYQWWTTTFSYENSTIDCFYADGFGGQYIFILPALNSVVVFNGRAYQEGEKEQYNIRTIMENHILPALL